MRISDWSSDVCSSDLADHAGRAHDNFARLAAEVARDLFHDLLDRLAPAIAGEGVAVARVDDQRAALAALDLLAAKLDLGRATDVAREHARDDRAGCELDIGEVDRKSTRLNSSQ